MNLLAKKGLHDLKDERWNAYGQFTYISSWKGGLPAAYTNLNGSNSSLLPGSERSFTGTATLYLGLKTWNVMVEGKSERSGAFFWASPQDSPSIYH